MEQENYYKVVDMTDEEKREMYMKLTKEELVDMLIQSNKITAMLTGPKPRIIEEAMAMGISVAIIKGAERGLLRVGSGKIGEMPTIGDFSQMLEKVQEGDKGVLIVASGEMEVPRMDDAGLVQLIENIQRDAARRLDELAYSPTFDDLDKQDKWKKNKYHRASRPRR